MTGTTPWLKPKTAVQVPTTASYNWLNLPNILQGGVGSSTGAYISGAESYGYKTAQLIKGGAQGGTNKGTPTSPIFGETKIFGGAADLWGNTLTRADVLATNFGVAFELSRTSDSSSRSYIIQGTGFDFVLPSDAVIVGVEFRLTWSVFSGGGGTTGASVDGYEMRLTYTFNPKVTAVGDSSQFAYVRGLTKTEQDKKFRFLVYDSSRNYVGELTKQVINEPSYKTAINTLHSNMALDLAQNELSTSTAFDTLVTDADELLVDDNDESLLVDLAASVGLGPGSNMEVNNEVDVIAYYGKFEELITDDGEPLVTDDDELLLAEDGAPEGKTIFSGYISQWELLFGDGDKLAANLLSHSKELDNIMLETEDTISMAHGVLGTGSYGIAGGGPDDFDRLAQVFRHTGATGPVGRLRMRAWPGWASDIPATINIYAGSNPNALGALLASSSSFIEADPDVFRAATYIDWFFDPATFTNGSDYTIVIDTDYAKTGGNPTYPANFYTVASDVANGQLYVQGGSTYPTFTSMGTDLWFELYTLGGATTRTFNSQDPSNILKQILDFARLRGARVSYDNDTIEPTGSTVSITFKTNTISEAIDAVLKTAPADWYYYYDYGTNMLHFHPRPTRPAHYYTRGRDTVKLKIKRTIEKIINDVYFTGGGSPTPLFIRNLDQTRINDWRRALAKQSDNRVTVQSTATILAQALIDQYGDPLYSGNLMVVRVQSFRVEDVTPGELSGFISFGTLVDALQMQNMSLTYHPDYLDIELDQLTAPVQKRIEDIKRNLELLEHANDPTSPTIT